MISRRCEALVAVITTSYAKLEVAAAKVVGGGQIFRSISRKMYITSLHYSPSIP